MMICRKNLFHVLTVLNYSKSDGRNVAQQPPARRIDVVAMCGPYLAVFVAMYVSCNDVLVVQNV
jgi:hypothetical protein